jgi:hypothetical protein
MTGFIIFCSVIALATAYLTGSAIGYSQGFNESLRKEWLRNFRRIQDQREAAFREPRHGRVITTTE